MRRAITDIFERNYRCYGYRRIHALLSDQSLNISEKVVRRLVKQECLVAVTSKRRRYGSYMGEISPAPDNLLNCNFIAEAPNEKWFTDITEFQISAGKVYLSPMIDCFDGMVVRCRASCCVTTSNQAAFSSACRASTATASECGAAPPSTWSTRCSTRRRKAKPGASRTTYCAWT